VIDGESNTSAKAAQAPKKKPEKVPRLARLLPAAHKMG
jgi:hypothetical protein